MVVQRTFSFFLVDTITTLEEPSKVQAGKVALVYRRRVFSHTYCWCGTVVGTAENQPVCAALYLTGQTSLLYVGILYFYKLEKTERNRCFPSAQSLHWHLAKWGELIRSAFPSHLPVLFSHLQPAPRCRTLQSTLWLVSV